jgi:hypothetical protein
MNRVIILCVAVLTAGIMHAQIPNPGFETWVSGVPSGWDSVGAAVPGSIEQSSTAHGGSSAARGNVVSLLGFTLPPLLYAGDDGQGFPVSQRHGTLSGFYQFNQVGGDIFYVTVGMLQAGSPIGAGVFVTGANQASYAQFDVPISYVAGGNPDTCYIWITILDTASGFPHLGSYFIVDDLSFSGITAVDDPAQIPGQFALRQNYPNPFNPSTSITFTIPEASFVSLRVFDVLGREVGTLVSEELRPGVHTRQWDASGNPAGVYYYTLRAGDFTATRKLVLVK